MRRCCTRLRALRLVPLIVCLGIQTASAHPFDIRSRPDNGEAPQNTHNPDAGSLAPPDASVADIESSSWPTSSAPWRPTMTVLQISDGHVQEPYTSTASSTSTSRTYDQITTTTVTSSLSDGLPYSSSISLSPSMPSVTISASFSMLSTTSIVLSASETSTSRSMSSIPTQTVSSQAVSSLAVPSQTASSQGSSSSITSTVTSTSATSSASAVSTSSLLSTSSTQSILPTGISSSSVAPIATSSAPQNYPNATTASLSSPETSSTTTNVSSSTGTSTQTFTTTDVVSSTTTEIFTTVVPDSSLTSLTTSEVQTATISGPTNTVGTVQTSLETSGHPSTQPFATSIATLTSSLSLVDTSTLPSVKPTASANVTSIDATNIFQPIATDAPPAQISQRSDHPVPRLSIQNQQQKLQTNKFYANFFLGDQTAGTWTHPYSVTWSKGAGETKSWGLAISHVERNQVATGGKKDGDAGQWGFFGNPVGIQSVVLSATELGSNTTLTTDSLAAFSINVNLAPAGGQLPVLTFPLCQGMAFITGVYTGGTPLIQSGIGVTDLTYVGAVVNDGVYKYRAKLANDFTWLIYVTPSSNNYRPNTFTLSGPTSIQGLSGFQGYIQVAKIPGNDTDTESVYDGSAGAYPTAANLTGSVRGTAGSYTLSWTKAGVQSQPLLTFALPHQLQSFSNETSLHVTDTQLVTTSKGYATAVRGDSWTLIESELPVRMSFAPWSPSQGSIDKVSDAAVKAINAAGLAELSQNMSEQTNVGSMYYDGKALAKFAAITYTLHDIVGNTTLALTGLEELEAAFALHVNNQQTYPLVYESAWGGVVSVSTYETNNSGEDFGNTYYNDHHYHYGYFIYTAAVIAYIDPGWLMRGTNKAWVNMLIRDYANSVDDDPYFPFSRHFDWYHGHSWAHGLYESADGKDQESSSEDTMSLYGMKMWGRIIGDTNMEARGNLQLAIQARSLRHYYLYTSNNTVEPSQFTGNKAAGIVFENKIDHTTYFGTNVAYIEGIHMLPLMPCSTLSRRQQFVKEEWSTYFEEGAIGPASQVEGGWRGILIANLAIVHPKTSYDFFANTTGTFDMSYLDGGASRTWYLAWSAALGGSPAASNGEKTKRRTVSRRVSRQSENNDGQGQIAERPNSVRSQASPRLRQRAKG